MRTELTTIEDNKPMKNIYCSTSDISEWSGFKAQMLFKKQTKTNYFVDWP